MRLSLVMIKECIKRNWKNERIVSCIAENVLGDSFGKVLDDHVIINVKKKGYLQCCMHWSLLSPFESWSILKKMEKIMRVGC